MIIDTCFLIDILRNNKVAVQKLEELIADKESVYITSLTIYELFRGIKKDNELQRNKIKAILHGQILLSFDPIAAELAGELDIDLQQQGEQIEPIDCMIAAIALLHKEKILTKNIDHFNRIKGLQVEGY